MAPKEIWDCRVTEPAHQVARNELVFVRSGCFFETFGDHAKIAARLLGLALTSHSGLAMAGFPSHQSNAYTAKLVADGYRVALVEPVAS